MNIFNQGQAALVELLFIAAVISSLFVFISIAYNPIQPSQDFTTTNTNTGLQVLLLYNNSEFNVVRLIQDNISLVEEEWDPIVDMLNSTYLGNLFILNEELSIIDMRNSCPPSQFNPTLFTIPIFIYNLTTYNIIESKYVRFQVCRRQ